MSACIHGQCVPKSTARGDSIYDKIHRHCLKNEFFYGTVIWFWIIFALAKVYLWRIGC